MVQAARRASLGLVLLLSSVGLNGCISAPSTQSIRPLPTTILEDLDATKAFESFRQNQDEQRVGAAYVGIVLTMRAGNQRIIAGHPFVVVPFTPMMWSELQGIIDAAMSGNTGADLRLRHAWDTYSRKMQEAGIGSHFRAGQTDVSGAAILPDLPAGEYIVYSGWRGYRSDILIWLVRFQVTEKYRRQVMLTNANAVMR